MFVILGVTTAHAPTGFAPLAIGLTLTLIHLISIPIDNTSVNPARSLGVAFFNGNGAPGQVWVFIVAPIVGAVIAGLDLRGHHRHRPQQPRRRRRGQPRRGHDRAGSRDRGWRLRP